MVLVLQQSGPPERFGGDLYIRGRAVPGDTWLLPSSTVPLSSSFWHTGMCVAYGWHHAVITHAPKYRKYWASLSGTALVVSLNLFLRLWLYASCSRAPSCTGPRMRLMCVCGGKLDGSLGALPGRPEERKLRCRQKAFVLKAAGQARRSQSSLCPGRAYSLVG
jgi:hypothetical protein